MAANPAPPPLPAEVYAIFCAGIEQATAQKVVNSLTIAMGGKVKQWYESPEWILVIVAAVTAFVIGWQSWATMKAAKAALLNAQAVVNAERPWIMIHIQETTVDRQAGGIFHNKSLRSFQFSIFNYGKTPAHIISCKGPKIEFCAAPDTNLPIPPDYGVWDWNRTFLAPRDSLPIGAEIYPSDLRLGNITEAVSKGEEAVAVKGDLVVYGLVEYSDGVSGMTYQTAFCYRHELHPLSSMGGHMLLCGPAVYNEYT